MTPSRSINIVDTPVPLSLCRSQSSMYQRIFLALSHLSILRLFNHTGRQRDVNIHTGTSAWYAVKDDAPTKEGRAFLHTCDTLMIAAPLGWHLPLLHHAPAIVRDTDI